MKEPLLFILRDGRLIATLDIPGSPPAEAQQTGREEKDEPVKANILGKEASEEQDRN